MEQINAQDKMYSGVIGTSNSSESANATGVYTATCLDKDGNLKWTDTYKNIVTTYGKDMLLNTTFRAQTASSFYLGLSKGYKALSGSVTSTTSSTAVTGTSTTPTTITATTPTVSLGSATVSVASNVITVSSTTGVLPGMAVQFGSAITSSSLAAATTYYVLTVPSATTFTVSQVPGGAAYGGTGSATSTVTFTSNTVSITSATGIAPGMTMWVTGATTGGLTGATLTLASAATITLTGTIALGSATVSVASNVITVSSTTGVYAGMPVQFGSAITSSSLAAATTYYVLTVPSATTFTVAQTVGGAAYGGTGSATSTVTFTSNVISGLTTTSLAVGNPVIFNTTGNGITSGTYYWVTNIPAAGSIMVSTTPGGTNVTLTAGSNTNATTTVTGTNTKYYVTQVSGTTLTVSTTAVSPASYTTSTGVLTTTYTTGGVWGTTPTLTSTSATSIAVIFTTSFSAEVAVGTKIYDPSYNLIGTVSTVGGDSNITLAANAAFAVSAGQTYADPAQLATDTILSAPRWQEDLNYAAATRSTPSFSASSVGSMQTSAAASFAINATTVIGGTFLIGGLTQKGSTTAATATGAATTGVLYSAGNFSGGNKSVASGDTLNVTYTASV